MKPGLAEIIEKARNSTYFECPETDLQLAENACSVDYSDTWCSTQVQGWVKSAKSRSEYYKL
jgi:hypothetical protein